MRQQLDLLRELVRDSLYVVDERAVADAIIAREAAYRAVIGQRCETPREAVPPDGRRSSPQPQASDEARLHG
jgi:hypothetical protein